MTNILRDNGEGKPQEEFSLTEDQLRGVMCDAVLVVIVK